MASPRLTQPVRLLTVLVLAVAASMSVFPAGVSQAEKRPSMAQVERQIDALGVKVATINEEYGGTRIELAGAARKAAVAQARVRSAERSLQALRKTMNGLAIAAYKSGGTDQFVQLVSTSTPQTFLDRASSLNRIAAGQSAQLAAAATARHRLKVDQRAAAQALGAQRKIASLLAQHKAAIQSVLEQQQRLLGSLKAEERRALLARRAAAARTAQAQAVRATRSRVQDQPSSTYSGPASGRAAVAVQEAYRKLGKPYQWGAAGPDRFDCSGLTMWVWGKAGVSLPHQSRAQYSSGRKVAKSDLQPGDLTYYGSPIHHVGVYVGGGRMISAPQTGDVVKLQNALRSDYVGATRP